MADEDEDAIDRTARGSRNPASPHADHDISDETQDFRFLNSVSLLSDPSQQSLPRRGDKDFEPNPTLLQADALASSRQAMHNAIAYPRLHNPKNAVVGVYCPDGVLIPPKATSAATTEGGGSTPSTATDETQDSSKTARQRFGVGGDTCVCIPNARGGHFRTMGKADSWNRVWLLPEETLYLLERGSLDVRWPASSGLESDPDREQADAVDVCAGLPMSLQAAYAIFVGRGGLTMERYTVYAGLKRGGYAVVRAPDWDETLRSPVSSSSAEARGETLSAPTESHRPSSSGVQGLFSRLFGFVYNLSRNNTINTATGPVIGLGIYRNYHDIFHALSIIPHHDPTFPDSQNPPSTTPPYRLAFHVYKPSTTFRKSCPGPPDFQLAVVSARTNPTLPSLEALSALLANTSLSPPRGQKMDRLMYMRLRHGWRNVILAVVDQGVVSFLRVADAGFGMEKLYAAKPAAPGGGKGGGKRPAGRKGKR